MLLHPRHQTKKARLILEDGSSYEGISFGAEMPKSGEVVFNTGMVGYPETFTDPSYKGQILILTYPLIGNYGIPNEKIIKQHLSEAFESEKAQIQGLIVTEYSRNYHHWRANGSLSDWLKKYDVPGISGIDTRMLTQKIREKGAMLGKIVPSNTNNATITHQSIRSTPTTIHSTATNKTTTTNRADTSNPTTIDEKNTEFYDPNTHNVVAEVSIKKPILYESGRKKVIIIDTGIKHTIIRNFLNRNITVYRVPWNYDFFEQKIKFDGVFIANGPGDPAIIKETHRLIQTCLNKKIPTVGICLGNQILAIAAGGKTFKLKYGHRSQNQPVIDLETGRAYITSQNHGFAVDPKSLPKGWKVWFENANDHTVEGIKHEKLPFLAVQFHPEATPGPIDTTFLFDTFIKTF
ncbi:glutamine-hydrolyzing carbamoyl-phosphate synthase small subunit [Candidatus Peregrinibacteria bacterium]|nr:glutamine-hydrolyzing carbamoyl-phosphate synthase small subunit [Candidatus Peregrinibacteria bacterium]